MNIKEIVIIFLIIVISINKNKYIYIENETMKVSRFNKVNFILGP